MILKSVRWRLPLSYAAIALLAAVALGVVLLTAVNRHFRQHEFNYLTGNAQAIGATLTSKFAEELSPSLLEPQLRSLSFLSQTRVRLLDSELRELADSGAPEEQLAVVTLAVEAEWLDIRSAEEMPDTPEDVAGLFVRREDQSLFLGTGQFSAVKVEGEEGSPSRWEYHFDGPVVEVITHPATQVYRDDTLQQFQGVPPSEPIDQVLELASLDELGDSGTVRAWGEWTGGRLTADVIVFSPSVNEARDSAVMPGEEQADAPAGAEHSSSTEPGVDLDSARTVRIVGADYPESAVGAGDDLYVYSTSAVGAPYGFALDAESMVGGKRSDQVARQAIYSRDGELLGYVELSEGPAYGRQVVFSVAAGWAAAGGVAVLLAAAAGWWASRSITQPLLKLALVTAQMADGDLRARADVNRADEFGRLANSFNHMAGRVEDTVGTLRRFVADAAHALHTPLTALQTNLELAAEEEPGVEGAEYVQRALTQTERLAQLASGLLDLSRLEAGEPQGDRAPVDLTALIREASEPRASQAEQGGLAFRCELPEGPMIAEGAAVQLRRALENLLDNALKFTPAGGEVVVALRREGKWGVISIQDTGIGIPAADLPDLFNRFHRGRNVSAYPGSGLGLAIVKAVVEGHEGLVAAERTESGSRFEVRLPLADQASGIARGG
jgi:signal transduction histidine kinase